MCEITVLRHFLYIFTSNHVLNLQCTNHCMYLEIDMSKFVSLQVSTQILPQMQPELPEKCRKPAGHAAFPGLLSNLSSSHPRGGDFRFLRKHVCPQQLQTWTESQER